jgi:hypothetical protein
MESELLLADGGAGGSSDGDGRMAVVADYPRRCNHAIRRTHAGALSVAEALKF